MNEDERNMEAAWENRTRVPIEASAESIVINRLDRVATEKQTREFSRSQIAAAHANPKTHRDPVSVGDPATTTLKLAKSLEIFSSCRASARSYARSHHAHIAPSFGVFADVWAGTDASEFADFQKNAKTQAATKGEIQCGWYFQEMEDGTYHYTIGLWFAVPKNGIKLHRGRQVVDWKGMEVMEKVTTKVPTPGNERRALEKALRLLGARMVAEYKTWEREWKKMERVAG